MKFFKTVVKNFKVLFRARTSLLAVLLGPLLVIGLIGFAFNSSGNIQLSVGYNAPDESNLTMEIVSELERTTNLQSFDTQDTCKKQLELGLLHACVFFPADFIISNDQTNNITYIVDKSRVNLVYTVIEVVSEKIGIKADEVSKSLTETLLSTLTSTTSTIDNNLVSLIKLKRSIESASTDANTISDDLGNIDLDYGTITIPAGSDINTLSGYTTSIKNKAMEAYDEGYALTAEVRSTYGSNSSVESDLAALEAVLDELNKTATNRHNDSITLRDTLETQLDDANDKLSDLEDKLEKAQTLTDNSRTKIATLRESLATINTEVDAIKSSLELSAQDINNIEVTSSDKIINPINTNIETISSNSNQLLILFPFVLVLVIMFVGLMLSSTLVVVEKKSKASFRIFTTPTRDEFFIFTTFVTSFIIVAVQVALILVATNYFLVDIVSANILMNIVLLILASSIFIMMGMAVGYLLSSQQGANMLSISLGAIFLFFSNIMLPLETLPIALQKVAYYNPFVLASESLRKSILFNVTFNDLIIELGVLLGYTVVIFLIIILFQRVAKVKFFTRNQHVKDKKAAKKYKVLWLGNKKIEEEKELIRFMQHLSDEEYQETITKQYKDIKYFLRKKVGKQPWLNRIKKLSREEFIIEFAKSNRKMINDLQVRRSQQLKDAVKVKVVKRRNDEPILFSVALHKCERHYRSSYPQLHPYFLKLLDVDV